LSFANGFGIGRESRTWGVDPGIDVEGPEYFGGRLTNEMEPFVSRDCVNRDRLILAYYLASEGHQRPPTNFLGCSGFPPADLGRGQ